MANKLKNKIAVVTGSGQGIGRSIALAMATEGATVVTNNRSPGSKGGDAETVAKEIRDMGGKAMSFFGDISSFEVGRQLIQTTVDKFGRIDILVNNAGYRNIVEPWEVTEDDWDRVVDIILKGTFNCCRHAIPFMMKQKSGRIINCTSGCWISCTQACHYGAAKAGIVGFTRALAADLGQYGITCNAYHPFAQTAMTAQSSLERDKALFGKRLALGLITKEEYERGINKPGPEGIGPVVAYMATDEFAGVNGKMFYTCDGFFSIYTEETKKKTIIKKDGLWTVEELMERVPKELLAE